MTEEKQNIAIYKLLGYQPRKMWRFWADKDKTYGSLYIPSREEALKRIEEEENSWFYKEYKNEYEFSKPEEYDDWYHCPQITLDLLHRAEKLLKYSQTTEYFNTLNKLVKPLHDTLRVEHQSWHASKEQRKEAILKVFKLWEK